MENGKFNYSVEKRNYLLYWSRRLDIPGFFLEMALCQKIDWLTDVPLWVRVCEMTFEQYEKWRQLDRESNPVSFLMENNIELFEKDN